MSFPKPPPDAHAVVAAASPFTRLFHPSPRRRRGIQPRSGAGSQKLRASGRQHSSRALRWRRSLTRSGRNLVAIKAIHTLVWTFFVVCIAAISVFAWRMDLIIAALSIGVVSDRGRDPCGQPLAMPAFTDRRALYGRSQRNLRHLPPTVAGGSHHADLRHAVRGGHRLHTRASRVGPALINRSDTRSRK